MDMITRLKIVLPSRWFADDDPVLQVILTGMASVWDNLLDQLDETKSQARLLTANGSWLDGKVEDFLGSSFLRKANEDDLTYAKRASKEILRERGTRAALSSALFDLTGSEPRIFEFTNTGDTGGYGHGNAWSGLAWGVAGGWGSLRLPAQFLVDVDSKPTTGGISAVGGWGSPIGGFGIGSTPWQGRTSIKETITDADVLSTIRKTIPAGVTAWTKIQ